jgi:hypothetical protein
MFYRRRCALHYDGHTWAVPIWNMAHSLWYRPSVFQEAGVEVPTTWDEWLAAVEKLTKEGQYGIGLPANKQLYTDQTVYDLMINAGADEIYNSDGTLRFNNPQTVEAFDMYNKLYKFSPRTAPAGCGRGRSLLCQPQLRDGPVHRDPPTTRKPRGPRGPGVAPIPYKELSRIPAPSRMSMP